MSLMITTNQKFTRDMRYTQKRDRNSNIKLKIVIKPQGKRAKGEGNKNELRKLPESS